jgi:hypothetical protein
MNQFPWEDNLLERKVESDLKDILKTVVAFANSVNPGHTATLLIGERNDGTVAGVTNPNNIQKTVCSECEKIYPAISWRSNIYEKDGRHCVRVEIEYSGDTPHFGGPAWVRKGSESVKASDEVFQHLIDIRSDLVRELSQWLNKEVTVYGEEATVPQDKIGGPGGVRHVFNHRWPWGDTVAILLSVNRHWITLERKDNLKKQSEPLKKLTLSFDDQRNQLKIIVAY